MKRILWIVAGVVLILSALAAYVYFQMQRPFYVPGKLEQRMDTNETSFTPHALATGDWQVEPDIILRHFSAGSGQAVVVIHGGPGYPFQRPIPALAPLEERYQFHYYDQRGSGGSTRPFDRFSSSNYYANMQALNEKLGLGAQVADIERVRQILGEEQLTLIGHSFGGFLAALYASEYPDHVKGLVLVAPAGLLEMPPVDGGLFEQVRGLLPEDRQEDYAAYLAEYLDYGSLFQKSEGDLAALNAAFDKYYAAAAQTRGFSVPEADQVAAGGWMVQGMYISMGRRHDYRPALKRVTAPTLVIHGADDVQPEGVSREYVQAIPNARLEVLSGSGHFPFEDQPEDFARIVGEFIDQLP